MNHEINFLVPKGSRLHNLITRFRYYEDSFSERKRLHARKVVEHCHWLSRKYFKGYINDSQYTVIFTDHLANRTFQHHVGVVDD